jgi:hypothetical protein
MADRRRRARVLSACVALALALAALVASALQPQPTDASWRASEFSSGTFTAMTLQKPTLTGCTYVTGALGLAPVATITWSFPVATPAFVMPANAGFATAAGNVGGGLSGLLAGTTISTTPATGAAASYTTTIHLPLVSGTLSANYTVGVRTVLGSWSTAYSTALVGSTLAGLNPTCTIG